MVNGLKDGLQKKSNGKLNMINGELRKKLSKLNGMLIGTQLMKLMRTLMKSKSLKIPLDQLNLFNKTSEHQWLNEKYYEYQMHSLNGSKISYGYSLNGNLKSI